jgi:hypothetical protein
MRHNNCVAAVVDVDVHLIRYARQQIIQGFPTVWRYRVRQKFRIKEVRRPLAHNHASLDAQSNKRVTSDVNKSPLLCCISWTDLHQRFRLRLHARRIFTTHRARRTSRRRLLNFRRRGSIRDLLQRLNWFIRVLTPQHLYGEDCELFGQGHLACRLRILRAGLSMTAACVRAAVPSTSDCETGVKWRERAGLAPDKKCASA